MVSAVANEAALRFLAAENQRLTLMLAQAVGNLAHEQQQHQETKAALKEATDTPRRAARKPTTKEKP